MGSSWVHVCCVPDDAVAAHSRHRAFHYCERGHINAIAAITDIICLEPLHPARRAHQHDQQLVDEYKGRWETESKAVPAKSARGHWRNVTTAPAGARSCPFISGGISVVTRAKQARRGRPARGWNGIGRALQTANRVRRTYEL